jgi:hypothetical protein
MRAFFKACETSDGRTGYEPRRNYGSDSMTAVGMLAHLLLFKDPEVPLVASSATYLASRANSYGNSIQNGVLEFYTLYNATLAMQQAGGDHWERWNSAIRDPVVAKQSRGSGCSRGSWDPNSTQGGGQGGRIYSTALGTLLLEVYYRFARDESEPISEP